MEEGLETPICERCDDLISFLYDELLEHELRDFERHLSACSICSDQLASFKDIRSSVVAWRDQSLGLNRLPERSVLSFVKRPQPSALTAIRQFFSLSPLWLKSAVAFAPVLLFAGVALLLLNFKANPQIQIADDDKVYSEAEMKAKVEAGIQRRLNELNVANNPVKESPLSEVAVVQKNRRSPSRQPRSTMKIRRAPLTRAEREQLAADLGLLSPDEGSDLKLLSEQINR